MCVCGRAGAGGGSGERARGVRVCGNSACGNWGKTLEAHVQGEQVERTCALAVMGCCRCRSAGPSKIFSRCAQEALPPTFTCPPPPPHARTPQEARFDRHFVRDLTWSRHQLEELAERRFMAAQQQRRQLQARSRPDPRSKACPWLATRCPASACLLCLYSPAPRAASPPRRHF